MSGSKPYPVIIHAHFYQPPREDPWLDFVAREPGAAPFHDWNERIERECYRAVVAARITADDGSITRLVNTLESVSFNVGPTLLEWLEHAAPETYARFIEADRRSVARRGHGNAIAMPYHHIILPLASRRDKRTEVRWGMADFRRRFGREPEGMWLPETAVDDETLDVLAEAGIRFTILAPTQVASAPPHGMPGTYTTSGGRSIQIVVYHGPLSHQVAFGPLISNGTAWLDALAAQPAGATTIATDGETYGHHHAFGEMALAQVVAGAASRGMRLTNPAALMAGAHGGPAVELVAPSSWSCAHGVERWRSDCGCRMEPDRFPSQAWRTPLREALEWLGGELHARYAQEGELLLGDPWAARDALDGHPPSPLLLPAARELLEMERNALRMFTSCGWFFDDLGGIETLQGLRYAVRAIELSGAHRELLADGLARRLAAARSNDPALGTGADLLSNRVVPAIPAAARIAAGHAASLLFPWWVADPTPGGWDVEDDFDGGLRVTDRRTGTMTRVQGDVGRRPDGSLRFRVQLDDDERHELSLSDLPEPARASIKAALTTALFPAELSLGLHALGISGPAAVGSRLLELLSPGPEFPLLPDPALLHNALDLLELDALAVPFDAQTRFWELIRDGAPQVHEALAPFAARFGFAPATLEPEAL